MTQLSFFDPLPVAPRRAPSPKPRRTGAELAEGGTQRAMDHAQAVTADVFQAAALRFFVHHAANARGPIGVAEARMASAGVVPTVPNARAWGQIPLLARKQGYVEFAGHGPSSDAKSHRCPRGLWRWTGKVFVA